jgi:hypothetical protein
MKNFTFCFLPQFFGNGQAKAKNFLKILGGLFVLLSSTGAYGTISITLGSGGTNICISKAVGGAEEAFTTLGPITIGVL